MSQEALKMADFAYIHSIMSYGIILGGNQSYSEKIFKIQKKATRIITNSRPRGSCKEMLKNWKYCPYILNIFYTINICDKKQAFILY
jgi:hypothetical protein